jgi:AraC-type DNA-binding domain-containing proteins
MIFPIITEETVKYPFYVTGVGSLENQHEVLRPNGLRDHQILYVTNGKGSLKIGGKEFTVTSQMGFYFEPGIPHEYFSIEEPWTTWWVTFNGYAMKDFSKITNFGKYFVFNIYEMDRLNLLLSNIYSSAGLNGLSSTADASHALYRFLLDFSSCVGSDDRRDSQRKIFQLQPVLTYIESHSGNDIALSDMANIAGMTSQHLCRLFKRAFNMRPFEYLTRCRLQNAKILLSGMENLTLKEVASKSGFTDASYFCAVFKHYEGMTPIQFKKMHR